MAPLSRGWRGRPGRSIEPATALPDQDTTQGGAPCGPVATTPPAQRSTPARCSRRDPGFDPARHLDPSRGVGASLTSNRRTGRVVRRYRDLHPGELVHLDVKKQAKIPQGGGWRVNGGGLRTADGYAGRPRLGYAFVHSAVDAHSRLAYSEVHADEKGPPPSAFWRRARTFFEGYGITIERVLSDTAACDRPTACAAEWWRPPSATPTPSPIAPDQWKSRALQPHAPQRIGLRPALSLRGGENSSPGHMAPHVQPSSTPHGHRGPTGQSTQQRGWAERLAGLDDVGEREAVVTLRPDGLDGRRRRPACRR